MEKKNAETIVHCGNIIAVINQHIRVGEETKVFERAKRAPGVRIIIMRDNLILLSKEYRYELQKYDYRLPGGKVYDSLQEFLAAPQDDVSLLTAAKNAAAKEAHEEVAIDVKTCDLFHVSKCGATVEWDLYYFVAKDFEILKESNPETGEDITAHWVDSNQAKRMCLSGEMSEERSALTLLRFLM